jgi:hypothetical protein
MQDIVPHITIDQFIQELKKEVNTLWY